MVCQVKWSVAIVVVVVVVVALVLDRALMIIRIYPTATWHAGFVAYFYDKIRPGTAVELNQCRYSHRGMDVRDRHHPNVRTNLPPGVGGCRNGSEQCEDCRVTDPKVRIERLPSRSLALLESALNVLFPSLVVVVVCRRTFTASTTPCAASRGSSWRSGCRGTDRPATPAPAPSRLPSTRIRCI
jgi:hypothetical protein